TLNVPPSFAPFGPDRTASVTIVLLSSSVLPWASTTATRTGLIFWPTVVLLGWPWMSTPVGTVLLNVTLLLPGTLSPAPGPRVAAAPGARLAAVAVSVVPWLTVQPGGAASETKLVPTGSGTDRTAPATASRPLLLAVSVQVRLLPAVTVAGALPPRARSYWYS